MLDKTSVYLKNETEKSSIADKFLNWYSWVLLGYALCGRGFSYFGVPPAYIGEVTLIFGLFALSINKSIPKLLKLPQAWFLIIFMVWCCLNTIPYFSIYGLDAVRDAALWYYIFFALIVATLLISKPQRFLFMLTQYERFCRIFIILVPFLWLISKTIPLPSLPGAGARIISLKPADTMTHLSGITAFFVGSSLLDFQPLLFTLMFFVNLGVVALNSNRSGTLAFLNAFFVLGIANYKSSKIWRIVTIIILIILLAFIVNPGIFEPLLDKVLSIFVDNNERQGSKEYRLEWWTYLIKSTLSDYFWTGRGFGFNLGAGTGFDPLGNGAVRSPHNGHITVLSRTGVPGFVLWLIIQLGWAASILSKYLQCRKKGQTKWSGIFLTLLTYWVASMTVTSFEVIIEGPTGGIWLWTMYGIGLAGIQIYKRYPQIFDAESE
ncbi:O-antigen ligase family protein [Nostoc spongiaeforme FACHB-130]|uniref:O-antigen ligase family protein n=1 Tax=Nostoc spongiaeforme FACHB-130 TaxID=1357510 RepID=A0ABR8FVD1_9NOSO|nr:O-antigen ligase family protein [Nostoc spongiaeforme]MBD2594935.1 O-antigen ligase family protein [Nostoc spongiaeforme FACHB-130]